MAQTAGLKIIAITDHNTVEGYRRLVQIRNDMLAEQKILGSITDSGQTRTKLASIKKELAVFDDVLILPGVELEVSNGIHMLVIFNNSVSPDAIQSFIVDAGYNEHLFGDESPSTLASWDIFALYEQSKKHDCIVIDAHTDSAKGILNTIPKGATRASCFRSSQLCAICYSNEIQKEQLKTTLATAREYRRTTPVSFVKFSDAHRADDVGRPLTWVKLSQISFEGLRSTFANSSELVSTERPSVDRILSRLLREDRTLRVPALCEESTPNLTKMVCALHNSGGGHILVGVNEHGNRVGLPNSGQDERQALRAHLPRITECFTRIDARPNLQPTITVYMLQNDRSILSIYVPTGDNLISPKNDNSTIYFLKDGDVVVLSSAETQSLIEQRTTQEIERKVEKRLAAIEKDCHIIRNTFGSLPIVRKFDENSLAGILAPAVETRLTVDPEQAEIMHNAPHNGRSRGNVIFFNTVPQPPRLPSAYLRYSVPLVSVRTLTSARKQTETVYVIPGGGVYYSPRDYRFYANSDRQVLKIHPRETGFPWSMKFVACFLKSSFLLWYCHTKFGDLNIWVPRIFQNIRLPFLNGHTGDSRRLVKEIESNLDMILRHEREFLVRYASAKAEEVGQFTTAHNSRVASLAYAIDGAIYRLLGLPPDDVCTIEESLRLNDVFVPSAFELKENARAPQKGTHDEK